MSEEFALSPEEETRRGARAKNINCLLAPQEKERTRVRERARESNPVIHTYRCQRYSNVVAQLGNAIGTNLLRVHIIVVLKT